MNNKAVAFLRDYSFDTEEVDRLIVSCFLTQHKLVPGKGILQKYYIKEGDRDEPALKEFAQSIKFDSLEELVRAFEFVISPEEKVVTGAVYTPLNIREYIVRTALYGKKITRNTLVADISCGCAGFLITAAKFIQKKTGRSFVDIISNNLWGLDIAPYSVTRSKILLSLLALQNGETAEPAFNLFIGNALSFNWDKKDKVKARGGFDVIVGNPPYVSSKNIDETSKKLLDNWQVTKSGHPDLYIPFFELGMASLTKDGILGYITVNTFFKSINGRCLRSYFSENKFDISIIDFRGEQIFKGKNTYTCLCFIKNRAASAITYCLSKSSDIDALRKSKFWRIPYSLLNDLNGWTLGHPKTIRTVAKIEQFENKMLETLSFSTGIATLANHLYKFKPVGKTADTYQLKTKNNIIYPIEKSICRNVVNSNILKDERSVQQEMEQLIFPYTYVDDKAVLITEEVFQGRYPLAYQYLLDHKKELGKRDKGKAGKAKKDGGYEAWFAFGRNQGLMLDGFRLFLPHISGDPHFVLCKESNLLFCNGMAIVSTDESKLLLIKKILESRLFWFYIFKTSKPYSSDFFSLSKNYISQFSIPEFSEAEKKAIIKSNDDKAVLSILLRKYGLKQTDIKL